MSCEHINRLLNKYWSCETSVVEERELQEFFSGPDVPEELQQYIPLFKYIKTEQSVTPGEDFDRKLKATLEQEDEKKGKTYVTIRIFTPLLRIAASVLLIAGLGVSLYFIARQNNRSYFVETYQDPNAAMKQATYALEKISDAIQMSEEASKQTIQIIDDLNIDWSSLDSLSNINPDAENRENLTESEIENKEKN